MSTIWHIHFKIKNEDIFKLFQELVENKVEIFCIYVSQYAFFHRRKKQRKIQGNLRRKIVRFANKNDISIIKNYSTNLIIGDTEFYSTDNPDYKEAVHKLSTWAHDLLLPYPENKQAFHDLSTLTDLFLPYKEFEIISRYIGNQKVKIYLEEEYKECEKKPVYAGRWDLDKFLNKIKPNAEKQRNIIDKAPMFAFRVLQRIASKLLYTPPKNKKYRYKKKRKRVMKNV